MINPLKSEVKKWYWAVVIVGFVGALVGACYNAWYYDHKIGWSWFWFSICANLCSTLAAGILALMIQRAKDVSRKEDWKEHIVQPILTELGDVVQYLYKRDHIPWDTLLAQTKQIDFVVQSWDKWEESVRTPFRKFLESGGSVNLFVHNYHDEFQETLRKPWQQRMNRNEQQARDEITGTFKSIADAIRIVLPSSANEEIEKRLTIRLMKHLNWFCAIRFGDDRLLLSVYAHHHRLGVEAPFFLIRTDIHKNFASWFATELKQLTDDSVLDHFPASSNPHTPSPAAKTE